ncbi:hypothetical protein [Neisseria leonii]|uniref:hypothetical protein n=1 Tax=Neisseria leonii TaxID=2995413 RepID=UPI00237ACEA6|nr:hypothetical protein [Neisseria sp. 3986]
MNKYWNFALDTDRAETMVKFLAASGFITGWLLENWATGIVYGLIAPFLLIPIGAAAMLLGAITEILPKKTG